MKDNSQGKIYYVCFYSEKGVENKITTYPSVLSKIDYIVASVKKLGREVEILSISPSKAGKFNGFYSKIDNLESHQYISSRNYKNKLFKKISFLIQSYKIFRYLKNNVKEQDRVIVYHSLYNRIWLKKYLRKFKNKVILQIEDVFSEIANNVSHFKKQEWKMFNMFDKCLCVNDILMKELKGVPQKIVSYGSYDLPTRFEFENDSKIKIVYAGVVEQTRKAAFLATLAVKYLPKNYELHILGFGNEQDILALNVLIKNINKEGERVFFHERMSGEEYAKFLQSCQIALSTHSYDSKDDVSANYTFPSKILTYLANNLRVVAQRLTVLEQCKIVKFIMFYDKPDPNELAKAIKGIDITTPYDSREKIKELDEQFTKDLKRLLEKA